MAVPGSPGFQLGVLDPCRGLLSTPCPLLLLAQAPVSGPVDGARRLEAPLRRAYRPLNLLLGFFCALTGNPALAGRGDAALSNGRQHVNRPLVF